MFPGYSKELFDDEPNVDRDFVLNALLQHNFLPNQKSDGDELPPIITSTSFSESVARKLACCQEDRGPAFLGYDAVEYKLTRFNGVPRACSIPHPKAYATLALSIAENWERLKYVSENKISKIVPRRHSDGRIVIMDYGDKLLGVQQSLESSFGQRYVVDTDISNFYPSIYSHSVPWALVGLSEAKRNKTRPEKWYNKLDQALQLNSRNETNGIAIGPATSNIIAEAILACVDRKLEKEFTYSRYMDDYTAYCETPEKAERFVNALAKELSKYKLTLNVGKTEIRPLPQISAANWIGDLKNHLPKHGEINAHDMVNYLDFVVRLADQEPDGSVMKYGLKSLAKRILTEDSGADCEVIQALLRYALNLSFYQPVLIPLLEALFDKALQYDGEFRYVSELQAIMCEHNRLSRSDAISWTLYFANKYNVPIKPCCSNQIVESQDCIPMLLLYLTGDHGHQTNLIDFTNSLEKSDYYLLDQYWLLLYQLFLDQRIKDPYSDGCCKDTSFTTMKSEGVNFVKSLATP